MTVCHVTEGYSAASELDDAAGDRCTICGEPIVARGWCREHYSRWYRHGDPLHETARSVTVEEWFWSKVKKRGTNDCWEWLASRSKHGYGWFRFRGRMSKSHRVAWILTHGPIGSDEVVRHSCDNPPCCNPAHLLLGTQSDNVRDREERQRRQAPKGEAAPSARLTEDDVREIRSACPSRDSIDWAGIRELADRHGVSPFTIRDVIDRRSWRHIP